MRWSSDDKGNSVAMLKWLNNWRIQVQPFIQINVGGNISLYHSLLQTLHYI